MNKIMIGLIIVMLVALIFVSVIQNNERETIRQDLTVLLDMAKDKPKLCQSDTWRSEVDLRIDQLSSNLLAEGK